MNKLALLALAAGAALVPTAAYAQVVVQHNPGTMTHGRTFFHGGFHGGMFPHRLHRGFVVPPFWFGPQFQINNWQMYGFAQPPRRHRWVRYYDDAYLIDGGGRIVDTRYGLDWDRYGERWDMEDGIPRYHGRGDYHPDERDYAWVEEYRGRHADAGDEYDDYRRGYGPAYGAGYGPSPPHGCHPVPQQPCGGYGAGYGYGYGYGWGVAYPMVIETTVISGGCNCVEEVVTEEVVEVRERPRYRPAPRPRPRPRARPAPPPPGERG